MLGYQGINDIATITTKAETGGMRTRESTDTLAGLWYIVKAAETTRWVSLFCVGELVRLFCFGTDLAFENQAIATVKAEVVDILVQGPNMEGSSCSHTSMPLIKRNGV